MSMPFYVAPEQVMKDRADYARKGIARGRSLAAVVSDDGIVLCAENPSTTLRKISEIYDRIAFAGVGKYNEFDQLRIAGVRAADLKGFQYSRDDVDARSLANQYAQILGQIFTHEMKPMEVEILVAEVGNIPGDDQLFHILYDGTVMDERKFSVLGGDAEAIALRLRDSYADGLELAMAVRIAAQALAGGQGAVGAGQRTDGGLHGAGQVEVVVPRRFEAGVDGLGLSTEDTEAILVHDRAVVEDVVQLVVAGLLPYLGHEDLDLHRLELVGEDLPEDLGVLVGEAAGVDIAAAVLVALDVGGAHAGHP